MNPGVIFIKIIFTFQSFFKDYLDEENT